MEEKIESERGMELDVRVILVGRTGLDARLRLDPAVEMIRVKSPLEAIGELSDPIDEHSPRRAVVIVGTDGALESNGTGQDPSAEFVRGLRLVDPGVRVLRAVSGEHAGLADAAPFDGVIDAESTPEAVRAMIHRRQEAVPGGSSGASGEASPGVETPAPRPPPLGAEPKPTVRTSAALEQTDAGPAGAPAAGAPQPAEAGLGDSALVRVMLRGGDLIAPALDLIRARVGDPAVVFESGESAREGAAVVESEGRVFGHLICAQVAPGVLEPHAQWLAGWMRMGEQQAQLREAAFTDHLTGAWNRRYFDKFLSAAIERARTARHSITVLLFDIDDFKQFNDRYGHAEADAILIETVRLLRSVIRPSDRVCRIGGDEFAVIFHEPAGPRIPGSHPPESVFEIATRFQEQIRQQRFPKLGLDAPGRLAISGGLATFPWDGMTPEELVRCADARALEAKRRGKNVITFGPGDGA